MDLEKVHAKIGDSGVIARLVQLMHGNKRSRVYVTDTLCDPFYMRHFA